MHTRQRGEQLADRPWWVALDYLAQLIERRILADQQCVRRSQKGDQVTVAGQQCARFPVAQFYLLGIVECRIMVGVIAQYPQPARQASEHGVCQKALFIHGANGGR